MNRYRHDPTKSLVGFSLGEVAYAVEISRVREICNPLPVIALPKAPEAVVGVSDYRGEVVPVVDLRIRLGLGQSNMTRRTKWIIVDVGKRHVALIVDTVTDVFGTGGAELKQAPKLGGGEDVRGIAGVTTQNGVMTFVLDVSTFGGLTEPVAQQDLEQVVHATYPPRAS